MLWNKEKDEQATQRHSAKKGEEDEDFLLLSLSLSPSDKLIPSYVSI